MTRTNLHKQEVAENKSFCDCGAKFEPAKLESHELSIRYRFGIEFVKGFLCTHAWKYVLTDEDINSVMGKLQKVDRSNQFTSMDIAGTIYEIIGHRVAGTRFRFCEAVYMDLIRFSRTYGVNVHRRSESAPESLDRHVGCEGHSI